MNGDGRLTIDDVTLLVDAIMTYDMTADEIEAEGKAYVDLGLTSGTLWATCNIGASTPEEYGYYLAWGETQTKSLHYQTNYTFKDTGHSCLSIDNDAAQVIWGGRWRMPTESEMKELLDECDWEITTLGAAKGFMVKSRINQASIFLPAAGISTMLEVQGINDHGVYWTSNIDSVNTDKAKCLELISTRYKLASQERFQGATIRAVIDVKVTR